MVIVMLMIVVMGSPCLLPTGWWIQAYWEHVQFLSKFVWTPKQAQAKRGEYFNKPIHGHTDISEFLGFCQLALVYFSKESKEEELAKRANRKTNAIARLALGPFLTKKNRPDRGSRIAKNVDPRTGFIPHNFFVSTNIAPRLFDDGAVVGFKIQFTGIS